MGCSSCSSGGGKPAGCGSNGSCSSGGCNKLEVYDWLANMQTPTNQKPFDIVEVRFKNGRKGFYKNNKNLTLQVGDAIVVEGSPGYDVGVVSIVGELVKIQINKKTNNFKTHETRKIYRIATSEDLSKWKEARDLEYETMHKARVLALKNNLEMKISDVEYQGDKTKAVFYYTADARVDFRQLIKDMAESFKIRIEMRQIGARQESARLGGVGSCGRELCCSTWLTDFRSVSTSSARYQQLSLNPQKLAGQCGKLKCCLNYELDSYLDALKSFPSTDVKLKTENGYGAHIKTDVFKRVLWYAYNSKDSVPGGLIALSPERVQEIIDLNKKGKFPADLKEFTAEIEVAEPDYTNVVGQDNLDRFEHVFKKKKKKKKRPNKNRPNQNNNQKNAGSNNPKNSGGPAKGNSNKPKQQNKSNNNKPKQQNKPGNKPSGSGNKKKQQPKGQNRNNQNNKSNKPNNKTAKN